MKRTKKLIAFILSAIMICAVLTGCGSGGNQQSSADAQPAEHKVTDMAGREVVIPAEINTVGTFGAVGVINTFVELMGYGDAICNNMPERFTKTDKWAFQYKLAPGIAECPVFESAEEVDIETVLSVNPDLCIVMSEDYLNVLEEQGLTTVLIQWNGVEDVKECVSLLGDIFGAEDIAEDYNAYFDEIVEKAEGLTAELSEDEKKTVLYGSVLEYTQPHAIAEWWIEKAGGISVTNADGQSKKEYTAEDLLGWNPDVMFITSGKDKADMAAHDVIGQTSAVKNDSVYAVPTVAHTWGNRTPEQPLTVLWALNKLYPELYSEADLSDDISYFYSHFFNYEMSSEEIAKIIG